MSSDSPGNPFYSEYSDLEEIIDELRSENERLRARNKRLEEALEQVMAMMIERGSNNLPLGQMVRAALED